ncbi:MAG: glucokinase [Planctomycetota bacterium]|jgi:glucokinase
MILAGDVGGTKTRLAFCQLEDGRVIRQQTETFVSRDYSCFEEVVRRFINKYEVSVTRSCFGVPGPVVNGEAKATKLPWHFREEQISKDLNIPKVKLVNDLVATAAAVPYLMPEDLHVLHECKTSGFVGNNQLLNRDNVPEKGETVIGVLAPGTGLGQAFIYTNSGQRYIMASEGGHVDFAPTNDAEVELLKYLKSKHEHVSYDRILSGPGLHSIYEFLKDTGFAVEPPELNKLLREENPGKVITTTGKTGEYELCAKALDIFASILGAQAGNMVLTLMATGGIYLGGGIPTGIYEKLADGTTVKSYLSKGRLSYLVKDTPLYVILDDHTAILGAAYIALGKVKSV